MSFLRNITSDLRSLFQKEQVDRDLNEELSAYLEMAADKIKDGMSRTEDLRALRLRRGSLELESFVETCWQDLGFGIRTLRKSPGFTGIAVMTLAIGIDANTTIFSLNNALMFRSVPARDPATLVELLSCAFRDEGRPSRPQRSFVSLKA